MINKRILLAAVAAIGLGSITPGAASAQAYPTRPIKIIVPFLAGGTVDTARAITAIQVIQPEDQAESQLLRQSDVLVAELLRREPASCAMLRRRSAASAAHK